MISRRSFFLRSGGLLAASAAPAIVPWFARSGYGGEVPSPHRVLVIVTPNGPQFVEGPTIPGAGETDFALHEWWGPLERHKADGIFFHQCHQPGVPFGTHNEYGHQSGTIGALTARCTEGTNTATGPSLDQFIGQELFKKGVVLPKRSLLWGLEKTGAYFFEDAARSIVPIVNPYDALADIAPGFGAGGSAAVKLALQRKHFVLDHTRDDCKRLAARLGAEGRTFLQAHCDNIATLEAGVAAALDRTGLACKPPVDPISSLPASADFSARENRDASLAAFTELMGLAFSCDVTRVLGFQFAGGASRFAIPEKYGVPASATVDSGDSGPQMHAWTHNGGDPNHMAAMKIVYNWFAEAVARMIDKLKTTMDANGKPLFDSTVVLWTSEFGATSPHSNARVPIMIFGNGAGSFKTGRVFRATVGDAKKEALPIHQLFVSLCRHMTLSSVDSFGNHGDLTCGPLEWLAG